jgi:alkyl sulfatase BDS1-like metallo-beta-lactamase superfamily hydrolase
MADRPDATTAIADVEAVKPEEFAQLIAGLSDKQISEITNGPARKQVLDEIFRRMADHVDPAAAGGTNAVAHFKILDRPDDQGGGYDHYEVVFENGSCQASDDPQRDPNVTIKVKPKEFLKLASNQASGPVLFMTGKLKLDGDVMLASRLTSFFRIPSAS